MQLLDFIEQSPTAFHAVKNAADLLKAAGAAYLPESQEWKVEPGKTYYTIRNASALIAFTVPEGAHAFRIFAAHADSPSFKLKENPELVTEGKYVRLNVERYGGMIYSTWLDRPLSVAGRVIVRRESGFATRLVNIDRDLLLIPNVAIHMNREANEGFKMNPQTDLLPLFGGIEAKDRFMKLIAAEAGVEEDQIIGHDLFLYPRGRGTVWGADNEFISAPRIDDQECAFAGLMGFLQAEKAKNISVLAVFDNEEVGSMSRQGAASTFLSDTLTRISEGLGDTKSAYFSRIAASYMISADNGHALHPNHPEKTDPSNRPVLNGGILLKYSANQRYTTDGVSAAVFKEICRKAEVPYQIFFNRSDMLGGGTLGNISLTQVPAMTADIGLAQLAMHSAYETAGAKDEAYMERFVKELFS